MTLQALWRGMEKASAGLLLLSLASAGCNSSSTQVDLSDGGAIGDTPLAVTYYQDVAPILQAKCVSCHSGGHIAPFTLDSVEAAVQQAQAMKAATASHTMPPWPPGPLSPAFLHARTLTDAQIATLGAWADAHAPLGDPAHAAAPGIPEAVDIGVADMTADIGVDYVPDTSLTDDYRCFLVDIGATETRMITGYRITPGNGKVVHHVITTLFAAADRPALVALDNESPARAGWPCFGGVVPTDSALHADGSLGAWVPGVSSVLLPAGTGTALHAGDVAVVQVHYNLLGGSDPDRTKIEIKLAPKGTESSLRQLATLRLLKRDLALPANQTGIVETNTFTARAWALGKFYPDGEAQIVMVAGHMHTLGTHISIERTNALGTTTLLDIPAWNFHWQGSYLLAQPVALRADDQLTVRCEYNNTAQQREANGWPDGGVTDVQWGEGTHDEMCIGYVTVVDGAL